MTRGEVRALYERFGFFVYRRCLHNLRDPGLGEDALHDVFVRVLRYGDGYRGGSALAWLLQIANRVSLDRLGKMRERTEARPEVAAGADIPRAVLDLPEASLLLSQLLSTLPRPLQEVAVLTYVDGMNQRELAAELGCSTMTVKRRVRALHERARRIAGRDLEEEVGHVQGPT